MENLPASELILTDEGRIYHIDLAPEEVPEIILTVGDPARVERVSRHFDQVYFTRKHREFVTHRGRVGSKEVMVISSGIGTDNVEILMTELDALINVDFTHRKVHDNLKSANIIRIGTSGSLQENIAPGTLLRSSAAIGLDTLMKFYDFVMDENDLRLTKDLMSNLGLGFTPYMAWGDASLVKGMKEGVTLTCPGFYGPQGRKIRLAPRISDFTKRLTAYSFEKIKLSNFEMETAGLYAMGQMLGHRVISTNAIIANRVTGEFSSNPQQAIDKLIDTVLDQLPDA